MTSTEANSVIVTPELTTIPWKTRPDLLYSLMEQVYASKVHLEKSKDKSGV
jgi:hypothetical protein